MLSKRVSGIAESATIKMGQLAEQLRAEGKEVMNFTLGEPDFRTPDHICDAAKKAMDLGYTHYTSSVGIYELRDEIARKIREENKVAVNAENVIVTPGGKQAIYEVMMSILDDGDEVLLLDPVWVTFEAAVKLAGGQPRWVKRLEEALTYEALESAISEKTKLMVINSPNNPAGYVLSDRELKEVAEFAAAHDLLVLSDEIYEKIIYERRHTTSIASLDGMQERTIIINGFSKTYAMTGWRIGYAAAPSEIMKGMLKIQQHSVSCASSISQYAALAALRESQDCVDEMVVEFNRRRDVSVKRLNELGLRCVNPEGAFYAFVNTSNIDNDVKFTERLLEEAYIVVTPGSAFGSAGKDYVRFSFAASMEDIVEGLDRIEKML
jgi:aspartate aminotransferase